MPLEVFQLATSSHLISQSVVRLTLRASDADHPVYSHIEYCIMASTGFTVGNIFQVNWRLHLATRRCMAKKSEKHGDNWRELTYRIG